MDDDEFASRNYPIQENMPFQQRLWRFERLGWCCLCLLMVLTVLGAFSQGLLSSTRARSGDGSLEIEYERFQRNGTATQMIVTLRDKPGAWVPLRLGGDFFQHFAIETMYPQATRMHSDGAGMAMRVRTDGHGRARVYFSLRPSSLGLARNELTLGGQPALHFSQFIYP